MTFAVASKNGKVVPIEEATVSVDNIEFAYGFGVYETLRYAKGGIYFIPDHLSRLLQSAKIIELEHTFTPEKIEQWLKEFVASLNVEACNLKILLIGAPAKEDAKLFIFASNPFFTDKKMYQNGAKMISGEYERLYPNAKTLNMLKSYILYREARRNEAYDCLLVNRKGEITEGTRTNFYAIKGDTIYSAPVKDILEGVTRSHILEVAEKSGFKIIEQPIPKDSLKDFDGAFISSTGIKIVPIAQVNDVIMNGVPEGLKKLMKAYDQFLKEYEAGNNFKA